MKNVVDLKFGRFYSHVLLEITKRCNLKCKHCFTSAGEGLNKELDCCQWKEVVKDLSQNGFNAFTISGGEPLVEFEKAIFVAEFISRFNKNAKIYLFTNGIIAKAQQILLIKKYFNGVGTSIDGNEQTHDWIRNKKGCYRKTISFIDLLNKYGVPVFIQSMVTPQTQPYLDKVVTLAVRKNIGAIRFSHVDLLGRAALESKLLSLTSQNLEELEKQIKELKKNFKIHIVSNLVSKEDLMHSIDKFEVPSLHILPNGIVLPWEGLPEELSLYKYPEESLSRTPNNILKKNKIFSSLMEKSIKRALDMDQRVLDFDNIIMSCLNP